MHSYPLFLSNDCSGNMLLYPLITSKSEEHSISGKSLSLLAFAVLCMQDIFLSVYDEGVLLIKWKNTASFTKELFPNQFYAFLKEEKSCRASVGTRASRETVKHFDLL